MAYIAFCHETLHMYLFTDGHLFNHRIYLVGEYKLPGCGARVDAISHTGVIWLPPRPSEGKNTSMKNSSGIHKASLSVEDVPNSREKRNHKYECVLVINYAGYRGYHDSSCIHPLLEFSRVPNLYKPLNWCFYLT